MDEYENRANYTFEKVLNKDEIYFLQSKLSSVDGIRDIDIKPETIEVEYVTLQLSEDYIRDMIKNTGYPLVNTSRKKKGLFKRFVENLAKNNKQSYGSKRLDCCDLKH